jgi:hypothetical protein
LVEAGAHTTRHDTRQSIGIEQVLRIVSSTRSSAFSVCSKLVQLASDRVARSAVAGPEREMARAHVAHRAQPVARMQTSGPGAAAAVASRSALAVSAVDVQRIRHRGAAGVSDFSVAGPSWCMIARCQAPSTCSATTHWPAAWR